MAKRQMKICDELISVGNPLEKSPSEASYEIPETQWRKRGNGLLRGTLSLLLAFGHAK